MQAALDTFAMCCSHREQRNGTRMRDLSKNERHITK